MEKIRRLYCNFSLGEKRRFKTYLKVFHTRSENKALEFLKFMEKHPEATAEEASLILYGKSGSKAFFMLKSRLYEKMLEFLPLGMNGWLSYSARTDKFFHALTMARRNMYIATMLRQRGLDELAIEFFEKTIDFARKYAVPEIELDPAIRLRVFRNKQTKSYEQASKEIRSALDRLEIDLRVAGIYFRYQEKYGNKLIEAKEVGDFLGAHLQELEAGLHLAYSDRAQYYLLILKQQYFLSQAQYPQAKKCILEQLELIKNNESLIRKDFRGYPYLSLSRLEYIMGNFKKSIGNAKEAQKFYNPHRIPHYYAIIAELNAAVQLNSDKSTIDKIIIKAESSPLNVPDSRESSHLLYLKAAYAYKSNEPRKALSILGQIQGLEYDKAGWVTTKRILEIMILIEQEEYDLASSRIEGLRKHLTRYKSTYRNQIMYKLLIRVERDSFRFQSVKQEGKLLEALLNGTKIAHLASEPINFEAWYLNMKQMYTIVT